MARANGAGSEDEIVFQLPRAVAENQVDAGVDFAIADLAELRRGDGRVAVEIADAAGGRSGYRPAHARAGECHADAVREDGAGGGQDDPRAAKTTDGENWP